MDALFHPFLEDGKMRYHTYLCSCCHTPVNGGRNFALELEPSASFKFDSSYEKELTSIAKARGLLCYRLQFQNKLLTQKKKKLL